MTIAKIVSGGQTGVDRGALEAALKLDFPYGGLIPNGRKAEGGIVLLKFTAMTESESDDYRFRTCWNVEHSDATLILSFSPIIESGTQRTQQYCMNARKTFFIDNPSSSAIANGAHKVSGWLDKVCKWRNSSMNIMETEDGNVLVSIPIRFQTVCGRRRLVVAGQGEVNDIDLDESGTLIRLFARAKEWTRLLETGAFVDVKELAEGLKMDRPYVVRVLRLANLSPKILRAIIAKTLPDDFSTERLFTIKSDLWSEQEREIGLA